MSEAPETTGTVRAIEVGDADDLGRCVQCYGLLFAGDKVALTGEHHTILVSAWMDNDRQVIVHQQVPKLRHINCNDFLGEEPPC